MTAREAVAALLVTIVVTSIIGSLTSPSWALPVIAWAAAAALVAHDDDRHH